MLSTKKLYTLFFSLLIIFGLLITEFFRLNNSHISYENPNLKNDLIGNFSRTVSAVKEKDFVIYWNDAISLTGRKQKNISLNDITDTYLRQYTENRERRINFDKLNKALEELSLEIKKEPVNANLKYDTDKNKIKEFTLPQQGHRLNIAKTATQIALNLAQAQITAPLIIDEISPIVTKNSLAELGLTSLLAKGESDFKGSTPSRIHNINIGAGKFNGLLLKPGEEFSFNKNLGQVDEVQGYYYELVIKKGKTTPELGGGLCQIATTMFRAAVNSGLPVLERHPHSFPVHYYNPQGFDATIYPGSADLRFKNDTSGHLLIQSHIEGTKLTFEIFGSDDGRKVELTGHKILEQNSNGSMKTLLTRKIITADGIIKEDSFWSNYQSPTLFPLEKNPFE